MRIKDRAAKPPARLRNTGPRVISRAPEWRIPMRADVEASAADIEQSIDLLRRRL